MNKPRDRRAEIVRVAAELFACHGVSSTTVRRIGDAVGVLSGSLYHHFPSKDAIVHEIVVGYLENLLTRYRAELHEELSPRERLHALVRVSLQVAETDPHATTIYQNELHHLLELPHFGTVRALTADVQQAWADAIEAGRRTGAFRNDIDARVFYRFLRDAVWLSVRWHRMEGSYPVGRLADDCTSVFLDGFAARAAG